MNEIFFWQSIERSFWLQGSVFCLCVCLSICLTISYTPFPIVMTFGINVFVGTKAQQHVYKDFYFPPVSRWHLFFCSLGHERGLLLTELLVKFIYKYYLVLYILYIYTRGFFTFVWITSFVFRLISCCNFAGRKGEDEGSESPESGNRDEGYSTMSSDVQGLTEPPRRGLEELKEATDETDTALPMTTSTTDR